MSAVAPEDVISAYRFILGREPEASIDPEVTARAFADLEQLRELTLASPEARSTLYDSVVASIGHVWVRRSTYFGRQIHLCLSDTAVSKTIFLTGDWEPHVGRALRGLLNGGDTFVDVGANIGWFSLLVGDHLLRQGGGRVIAVEANPALAPRLAASMIDSGLDHMVSIKPYAVSDHVGVVEMETSGTGNVGSLNIGPLRDGRRDRNVVPCLPLDDLLGDLDRCDVVKMDIEGAELLAMRGFGQVLRRTRPKLLLEINATALQWVSHATVDDLVGQLRSFGYKAYSTDGEDRAELDVETIKTTVAGRGYWDFLFA